MGKCLRGNVQGKCRRLSSSADRCDLTVDVSVRRAVVQRGTYSRHDLIARAATRTERRFICSVFTFHASVVASAVNCLLPKSRIKSCRVLSQRDH